MSTPGGGGAGYSNVRLGKLKLKGSSKFVKPPTSIHLPKKRKRKMDDESQKVDQDAIDHGGYRHVKEETGLAAGNIALESSAQTYLQSMDNGKFTIGAPHHAPDEPSPEEVLTLIRTPDATWVSLKSGFGKYVGVAADGQLVATADAIGNRERFEFIFQDEKVALHSLANNCFLCFNPDKEGFIFASSKTAGPDEVFRLRTNVEKAAAVDFTPVDDYKPAADCELAYTKMYQHSKVDLKNRCVSIDVLDKSGVRGAQTSGDLHEHLLNRRVKTKSDKYC